MLLDISDQGILSFRYVLADSVYANSSEYIDAIEALTGVTYLLQIPEDTLCWLKHPVVIRKTYKYGGQQHTKELVSDEVKASIEVRKFPGWHHHMQTCLLSHYFLWHLKIRLGKKVPVITPSQLRVLLKAILLLRVFDIEMAIVLVQWVQMRNHRATCHIGKRGSGC